MEEKIEFWTPDDPENEPYANLTLPEGVEVLGLRWNTTLFRHIGNLAIYNYILFDDLIDDNQPTFKIFNHINGYKELEKWMVDNQYPRFDNIPFVTETVKEQYIKSVTGDLDDPVSWLPSVDW